MWEAREIETVQYALTYPGYFCNAPSVLIPSLGVGGLCLSLCVGEMKISPWKRF